MASSARYRSCIPLPQNPLFRSHCFWLTRLGAPEALHLVAGAYPTKVDTIAAMTETSLDVRDLRPDHIAGVVQYCRDTERLQEQYRLCRPQSAT